jgi:putative ABC transport system ATP-binding protein
MSDAILRLHNLSKSFILGKSKAARKAMKGLQKLQDAYEEAVAKHDGKAAPLETRLEKAQRLFTDESYAESYTASTGKHLKKRHGEGFAVHALKDIDLAIMPGELVAIVGPSGSGKSTLLNMLGLLDKPTAGQIFINGENVTAIKRRRLPALRSQELGFVFQSFNLVTTLTALENVMLPLRYAGIDRKTRRRLARQALIRVGLGNRLHHTPNELSGGQQQRVAIARSIVNHPAVIFGDELTGELDSNMTEEIMNLIHELNGNGQTFVIVTHNPEVARHCKRILYMRDGRIERDTQQVAGTENKLVNVKVIRR